MSKKRTKLEVVRDILETLSKRGETRITHIIYKANLSTNSIKPYIEHLLENEFIQLVTEGNKKFFKITAKGLEFLGEFNKMKIFSESYGLDSL